MRRIGIDEIDFCAVVRPGDTVVWGQACAEPQSLVEALMRQRHQIGRFRVFLGISYSSSVEPEHADVVEFVGLGGTGSPRRLAKAGVLDIAPLHITTVDARMRSGALRVDVVLIQLRRTERNGEYSLGLASDYVRGAVGRARVVVAEVNDQVPATVCVEPLHESDIDILVETSRPPVMLTPAHVGDIERQIAANAGPYVPDRATLQLGVGALPEAILTGLQDRRGLGVHSGIVGDRVAELMQRGTITNEHKEVDPGMTTTGLLAGTERLYGFAHARASVLMAPVGRTHGIAVLSRLRRFVAINSAVEVDLTGQVNAEAVGDDYVGLVGGQANFVRAANESEGGCAIIALPATTAKGKSRVVVRLSGPVTTPRSDVGVVVTEHGAADLRGLTVRERIQQMLAIAAPSEREALERESRGPSKT